VNDTPDKGPNAYTAYIAVALCAALASVGIALIAITKLTLITDAGMFGIAFMVAAPAAMAIGVAGFIHLTSRRPGAQP
jgi:NADH:ubiquinone oxidoreductase subunit K